MNIIGIIKKFTHKPFLQEPLKSIEFDDFDINNAPSSCIIKGKDYSYALSKWVSPKRTRSYPYERVYNTLSISKKITVIPVIKDEGIKGDRDFIQWDTILLMSLLDIYVILAYYSNAQASARLGKITNQEFENQYIKNKIKEIENFHPSASHWNLDELEEKKITCLLDKVKLSYNNIQKNTGVRLHDYSGIDRFKYNIQADTSGFKKFSRDKAAKAQEREFVTIQPKESLSTVTKAKITITTFLEGQYFFTVDEVNIDTLKKKVYLIEGKHCSTGKLPSKGDIKDGLLKIALYSNLDEIFVDDVVMDYEAVLCLTSPYIKGEIFSYDDDKNIKKFMEMNDFKASQIKLINELVAGARENGFTILIKYSK